MSGYLLVPMNLQALVYGKSGAPSTDFLYDLVPLPRTKDELDNWYGRAKYSFSFESSKLRPALPPGVHLHWALPQSLLHAHYREREEPKQYSIPNRWLVLRLCHRGDDPAISCKGWVVESDFVGDDESLGGVPFLVSSAPPEAKPGIKYVGRTLPLETWKEDIAAKRIDVKSLAWGDPSFAAYYPACRSVLGFHDATTATQGDQLTYLVIGWYADKAKDPLDPRNWLEKISNSDECLTGLRWSCSGSGNDPLPVQTLCHGAVVGLTWGDINQNSPLRFSGSKPDAIAVGGSLADALSAMLAPGNIPLQQVFRAFQYGQADELRNQDQLGELLHRQTFQAAPGGKCWAFESLDPPSDGHSTPPPPSAKLLELLAKLNQSQRNLDRHLREIESLQWRLFACWAAWASRQDEPPIADRDVVDRAQQALTKAQTDLSYRSALERCRRDIEDALTTEKIRLRLAESNMLPFLQPKDPFVVLKGEHSTAFDRTRPQRVVEDGEGVLQCRLATEVISGIKQSGTISAQASAADCFQLNCLDQVKKVGAELGDVAFKLALEALLDDPNCARLVQNKEKALDTKLLKELQKDLQKSSQSNSSGTTITWQGQPPDPLAITQSTDSNPWLPVYLLWQADWVYTHAKGAGAEDALDAWTLNPDPLACDLVLKDQQMQPESAPQLAGATMITAISGHELAGNLSRFGKSRSLTIEAQMSKVEETSILGQSLGGFNDLLLCQTPGLCLPPIDPTNQTVDSAVWKDAMHGAPTPVLPSAGRLLALRAGNLTLVNLYLVDVFGQIYKVIDAEKPLTSKPNIISSVTLQPRTKASDATLSPRFVQPARLNFDWQPAGADAYGPVCGWLVPNFLEKSFAVFSAGGAPLGSLESLLKAEGEKTIHSPVEFKWRAAPGSALAIANPYLQKQIDSIAAFSADEGQVFLELVDLVLRKSEEQRPAEDPRLSVLLGRPLAVVQASLGLELQGLPAGYWKTEDQWEFKTEGFEHLRVPVRLGGMNLHADGLIGYLQNGDFFPSDAATRQLPDNSRIKYSQKLNVSSADASPLMLTMLVDANTPIHATTGILPRQSIELPPEVARQASRIEDIYFNVAPVLSYRPKPDQASNGDRLPVVMPRPSDAFGRWSWGTRHSVGWRDIQPADARARFEEDLALSEGWLKLSVRPNQDTAEKKP
jgi:hypothetical protein